MREEDDAGEEERDLRGGWRGNEGSGERGREEEGINRMEERKRIISIQRRLEMSHKRKNKTQERHSRSLRRNLNTHNSKSSHRTTEQHLEKEGVVWYRSGVVDHSQNSPDYCEMTSPRTPVTLSAPPDVVLHFWHFTPCTKKEFTLGLMGFPGTPSSIFWHQVSSSFPSMR